MPFRPKVPSASRALRRSGYRTMVHVSAIGADEDAESDYARTKALGEADVLAHMPDAMILRPSIVFGPRISSSTDLPA